MWPLHGVCIICVLIATECSTSLDEISTKMEAAQIIPDVIDSVGKALLEITYPSGAIVQLGNELTPTNVKDQPKLSWTADPDTFYTLIMTDPDAPSRAEPTFREVRHWCVVNIPGSDVTRGDTIVEFLGSGPPEGTGLHRYVFLIFKQQAKLQFDEEFTSNRSRKNRLSSSTRSFVAKYNLGNPIAGNFYEAQFDSYVPLLHAQLAED